MYGWARHRGYEHVDSTDVFCPAPSIWSTDRFIMWIIQNPWGFPYNIVWSRRWEWKFSLVQRGRCSLHALLVCRSQVSTRLMEVDSWNFLEGTLLCWVWRGLWVWIAMPVDVRMVWIWSALFLLTIIVASFSCNGLDGPFCYVKSGQKLSNHFQYLKVNWAQIFSIETQFGLGSR